MFEIIYHYKEQLEVGRYSDEAKEKKMKVGSPYEEIPLEVVAGKIMAQLARRDILIVDVEIYEYSKKQINYKQIDDGITIKNKKFRFDNGPVVTAEPELDAEKLLEIIKANPNLFSKVCGEKQQCGEKHNEKQHNTALAILPIVTDSTNKAPTIQRKRARPIRFEAFNPQPQDMGTVRAKGFKFTTGKKYPIWDEKGDGIRMVYDTVDDSGRAVTCGAECFEVVTSGRLLHEESLGDPQDKESINLWASHTIEGNADQMPVLRG
jgi:hypothetical protein